MLPLTAQFQNMLMFKHMFHLRASAIFIIIIINDITSAVNHELLLADG